MIFEILKDKSTLEGTAYFEFLPGPYLGKCWNDHSIFLSEESMSVVEEIFEKHVDGYDHYQFSEMSREDALIVLSEFNNLITNIQSGKNITGNQFTPRYYEELNNGIKEDRNLAMNFIRQLQEWIEKTIKTHDRISILGL